MTANLNSCGNLWKWISCCNHFDHFSNHFWLTFFFFYIFHIMFTFWEIFYISIWISSHSLNSHSHFPVASSSGVPIESVNQQRSKLTTECVLCVVWTQDESSAGQQCALFSGVLQHHHTMSRVGFAYNYPRHPLKMHALYRHTCLFSY